MQEAITRAWLHLDTLRTEEKFKPWLFQILANCCRKILRERAVCVPVDENAMPDRANPTADGASLTLWDCISRLSEIYRPPVVLFYYHDLSVKEIARITGQSPATVRKRLSRAREQLREMLEVGTKESDSDV